MLRDKHQHGRFLLKKWRCFFVFVLLVNSGRAQVTNEIRSIAVIRALSAEQASQHLPVRLQGTLSFFDTNLFAYFLQDDTGGVYLVYNLDTNLPALNPHLPLLATGNKVEVEGETSRGEFAPVVVLKHVTLLGTGVLPTAKKVSFEDIATGQQDSQFVEVNGIVRSVDFDAHENHYHLKIATGGGFLTVYMNKSFLASKVDNLVSSKVRIRGICTSWFNLQRQFCDLRLLVTSPQDFQVETPALENPFEQPGQRIEQLLQFVPQWPRGEWTKVTGTVTYRRDDDTIYIQDEKEGLFVETAHAGTLLPGNIVEILGFPAKGLFTPKLEDAIFRKVADGQVPEPINTTTDEILKGTYDCRLVRIQGTVIDRTRYGREQFLVVQSGGFIFDAFLEHKNDGSNFSYLENGSQIAVVGVCVIDPGNNNIGQDWSAKSFRLLMRSANDITLLARPPWWNLRRMLWAVTALVAGVLLTFAWVVILRRRVRLQTAIIRRQLETEATLKERYEDLLENANDMVLTHDLQGRITSINSTGEQWLGQDRKEIITRNLLSFIVEEQRDAAAQWLEQIIVKKELAPVEWDFLVPGGQRLRLEISARLISQPGKADEVESFARDITERKKLEREILQISNREQRRIGHDLHDGVCQQLAAIAYRVDMLADQLAEKQIPEADETIRIGGLVNEVMAQTRSVARGLFPVRLEEAGLVLALEEIAVNAGRLFRIHCEFSCVTPHPQLETTAALHLYYITQEMVLNAVKHGKATEISVTITRHQERFLLTVRDNGQGFAITDRASDGMGIRIMRYRAQVIGATLDLKSEPGKGTQVICTFHAAT